MKQFSPVSKLQIRNFLINTSKLTHSFPMQPFSTPRCFQGSEKGCVVNKWVKQSPEAQPGLLETSKMESVILTLSILDVSGILATFLLLMIASFTFYKSTLPFQALTQQGSNQRSANRDLRIEFVFLRITLSSFSEIRE